MRRLPAPLTVGGIALLLMTQAARSSLVAQPAAQDDVQFSVASTMVVVDVVVHDRHGQPVLDLAFGDFELREDDVRQPLRDVQLIADGEGTGLNPSATAGPLALHPGLNGLRRPPAPTVDHSGDRFVALVFDRLSQEARVLAIDGARTYLRAARTSDRIGVFGIDLGLQVYAPYTNHGPTLDSALRRVALRASPVFDRNTTREVSDAPIAAGDLLPSTPYTAGAESAGRAVATRDRSPDEEAVALVTRSVNTWEALVQQQQSHASIDGLLALVSALAPLPGRKSLIWFGEGLSISATSWARFESLQQIASSAGVAIYAVDARGLGVHSEQQAIGREMRAMGAAGVLGGANLAMLERMFAQMLSGVDGAMTRLARQTGGLVIRDRNELGSPLAAVDRDRRFHYLLSYRPPEGKKPTDWRRLDVRVERSGVRVRHRAGYTLAPAVAQ